MNIKTTPFSPARWEAEYTANQINEETELAWEDVVHRMEVANKTRNKTASSLTRKAGSNHIEWVEELGYDFEKLSREASSKRYEAKKEWDDD